MRRPRPAEGVEPGGIDPHRVAHDHSLQDLVETGLRSPAEIGPGSGPDAVEETPEAPPGPLDSHILRGRGQHHFDALPMQVGSLVEARGSGTFRLLDGRFTCDDRPFDEKPAGSFTRSGLSALGRRYLEEDGLAFKSAFPLWKGRRLLRNDRPRP